MLRLPRTLRMEVHKVLRRPRILHVKKQVNTPITMEGRTGDHRRQQQTTADNATARASNGAWRFTECCTCPEFCAWRFTKCCACHEICTWRVTKCCACHEICTWRVTKCCACHEIYTWRFTKCCACHEICTWRFTKCCACHEFCTSRNQSQWRDGSATTADNRRQPPTTQQPEPLTEHAGSQSAVPATKSARDLCVCVCCLGVCGLCVCCLGVEGGGGGGGKRAAEKRRTPH